MDDPGWCWLIAAIFLILTTFFSTISLALRHAVWSRLQEAFEAQGRPARTDVLRARLSQLVCGAAALRMLANLGLLLALIAYFAGHRGQADQTLALPLLKAFIVSGIVLSVFSVVIPHAWAKYVGTVLLVRLYPLVRSIEWISLPLTAILAVVDPVVRRLAGVSSEGPNGSSEERQEEVLSAVEEGEKGGLVDEQERQMIASVLEFRDITAGEIMTPRTDVTAIEADTEPSAAAEAVISHGHSRYPVYEESIDKVIGMLYAKDLLRDLNETGPAKGLRHRLRKPYYVPESKTVRDLLHEFQAQKVHMAIVLDEYGGTAGVVTIEDILEELVGEIVDEYEQPQSEPVRRIDENSIEVDARCHVDELNDDYGLSIPDDPDYDTIGGFAFARLGRIPQSAEVFEHDNLRFTVVDVEERKINRLRIDVLQDDQHDNGHG